MLKFWIYINCINVFVSNHSTWVNVSLNLESYCKDANLMFCKLQAHWQCKYQAMLNTTKGISEILPFNHIAHQWQVLFLVSSSYSVWCPWFKQTDKNSIQYHVELHRTSWYSRWDHHVQEISPLSLHITFLPPQLPLCTPMILPTPMTTHPTTQPEMTATVHENTTPLQNHSHW